MDKLRGMETFVVAVESGSFTSAATRLEMSAVMVGKYVNQLEAQPGTHLPEYNTCRQSLTDAGRVYFEEAYRVLEQVSTAEHSVECLRLAPAGALRTSAPTSFGACVISPLAAAFLQVWPEARIELDPINRTVDLVDEGVDLAIRIGDVHQTDAVVKYLCPYCMAIYVSSDYLVRYGTPRTLADLVDHLCLSHTAWTARNEWILLGVTGEIRWKRDAILRCNDDHGLCMAAVAGTRLLLQPEVLLAQELATRKLIRTLEGFTSQPWPIHLLWRQDLRPSPKLTRFVEHMLEGAQGLRGK